jgi:hypothetical protein
MTWKLNVLIHRQRKPEPGPGTLKAWVLQDGQRGANLLSGSSISKIETAKQRAIDRLRLNMPAGYEPELTWTIDESDATT